MDASLGIDDIIDLFNQYGFYDLKISVNDSTKYDSISTEINTWIIIIWRAYPACKWYLTIYKNKELYIISPDCVADLEWFINNRPS